MLSILPEACLSCRQKMQENPLCRALKMQDPTLQDSGGPKSNENAEPDNAGPPLSASCSVGQAAK